MGVNKKFIVIVSILLILVVFIFVRSISIKKISYIKALNMLDEKKYILMYSGNVDSTVRKELKRLGKEYNISIYISSDNYDDVVNYVKLVTSAEEIKGNMYLVFGNNTLLGYMDESMNTEEYLKKYLYGYIPKAERTYNEPTVTEYTELYKSKDTIITVFGDTTCNFCKLLQPVINEVSSKTDYKINYINFSELTTEEANMIYKLNIVVPASCTSSGLDKNIKEGYSKPLTIVSKKGKIIGCIKGYYEYSTYLDKLKEIME